MSEPIRCFLIEATGRNERSLRRYAGDSTCPGRHGYHNARVPIDVAPDGPDSRSGDLWPRDDPRWPTHCACGYAFTKDDTWQLFLEPMYRRVDTGEERPQHDFPVGAMYVASWLEDVEPYKSRAPDGKPLFVRTPGGDWCIDDEASGGGGWTRTGSAPIVTASPSIIIGGYHGWLRDGVLVPC